jgi:hypothetical protein
MKIEHRKVTNGILQVTTSDERWYTEDGETFYKSNSWVTSFWPKGKGFEMWLKDKGDEAEQLKRDAGTKGSKVHQAIEDLLRGVEISIDARYMNHDAGKEEELTVDEYWTLMTFVEWWKELNSKNKVKVIEVEKSAINKEHEVGYTLDLLLDVDGEKWLIDHKTSKEIYMSHKLQTWFMRYSEKADKCFILQIGYNKNKAGYKLTEIEGNLWPQYEACLRIWDTEVSEDGKKPLQKDYPMSLKL